MWRMSIRIAHVAGLLFLVLGVHIHTATAANAVSEYSVVDLGDFNGSSCAGSESLCNYGSGAYGMNSSGDVVGWSYYTWDGSVAGFQYVAATGELRRLSTLGGWSRYAYAVNEGGIVVGTSAAVPAFRPNYPVLWTGGQIADLFASYPSCDMTNSSNVFNCQGVAFDINAKNEVVGGRYITDFNIPDPPVTSGAFLYADGAFTNLGWLPGDAGSSASAINERGDVVGTSTKDAAGPGMPCCGADLVSREGGGQAFLYRQGAMHGLGTLGGPLSGANDISDNRKVVGFADTADGARHAFLYTRGDGMRDLGTLGGSFSEATAISPRGTVIVGNSTTAHGEMHGFVYTRGKMIDLNDEIPVGMGVFVDAQDVNDSGQIAGRMIFTGSRPWEGSAVLLAPSPKSH